VRANHRTNHFDSAMDSNNNIYLAYVKDDSLGNPQVLFSTDFGETTPIYTGTVGEVIHSIKLHSDASGDLTLLVNNDTEKSVILTKSTTGSWSSAVDLDTDITDGMIYNVALVQTNTASGYFSDFKMTYLESRGVLPTNGEYNSSKIYFYALSAEVDGSNASQDISTVEQLVIDHYNGVDFSAKGTGVDGYTTTWSPTGYYVDGEEYGSGLWYSNGLYDITQTYVYIQSFGDVSLDSITSVNTTAWHPYGDALESLQLNHVYVVKTEDGYVKFKVLSLDSQSDNWNFTASYQFSSNTIF
ncbi:MAG: hypothetical protein U9P72_05940, partial [Campylobacterota bacterium]|nr:hypothetical protein [Campylobacterota bacterium]